MPIEIVAIERNLKMPIRPTAARDWTRSSAIQIMENSWGSSSAPSPANGNLGLRLGFRMAGLAPEQIPSPPSPNGPSLRESRKEMRHSSITRYRYWRLQTPPVPEETKDQPSSGPSGSRYRPICSHSGRTGRFPDGTTSRSFPDGGRMPKEEWRYGTRLLSVLIEAAGTVRRQFFATTTVPRRH